MKEFFDRYKTTIFLLYALTVGVVFAILDSFSLWKVLLFIPMGVLGGYLLWKLFPRSGDEHLTVVRVNGDGSVLITKSAVSRSITDAVKVIQEVKYLSCEVENSRTGINIVIHIKVLEARVVETSELVKEFVRNLLEEELNVKTNKIDIIVKKVLYSLKVKKIDPNVPDTVAEEEEQAPARKSKAAKAVEKAEKANMAPVPVFNSEYRFDVGNERKRVVVKGGEKVWEDKTETAAAKYPASVKTVAPVQKPVSDAKPAAPAYPVTVARPAAPAAAPAPVQRTQTIATPAPAPTHVPAPAPSNAPHDLTIDLKAELAKRKAEREALLNKISADSNKLN